MANAADNYQWNADNAFQSWDLNPLAQQVGGGADGVRDTLATGRDAYLQPLMQKYRQAGTAAGARVDEGDQQLYGDQGFQNFAKTGQTNFQPQNQTPSQQWSQQQTYAPVSGLPVTGTPAGEAAPNTQMPGLFQMLMDRIQQPITPDANDPTIRRQADAFSANQTRASRNYLADAAEAGGPYQNLQGESRLAAERVGQSSGAFEAGLIGSEQDKRRAAQQHDLDMYGSQLSDQQRLQLQEELGLRSADAQDQSNANNRYGIDMNRDAMLRELALRQWTAWDDSELQWAGL